VTVQRSGLALVAAAVTGVQVGTTMVATRFVIDAIAPAPLAFLRYAIGVVCLTPVVLVARNVRFARADLLPIALLGTFQFGVLIYLLNVGLQTVTSARAALIFASSPLLTLIFAVLIGHERFTAAKLVGVLLTILGVGLAFGEKTLQAGAPGWTGEAAVLGSALTAAICSVLYRPYLARYPTLPVSALAMAGAAVALAVPALLGGLFATLPTLTAGHWAAILFVGIASGGGYVIWLWALANASATRVTVFLALSPITAVVLGAALLAEPVSATMLAGVACVVAGLWCANLERT